MRSRLVRILVVLSALAPVAVGCSLALDFDESLIPGEDTGIGDDSSVTPDTLDGSPRPDTADGSVPPDTTDTAIAPDTLDGATPDDTLDGASPDTLDGTVTDTLDGATTDTLDGTVSDTLEAGADTLDGTVTDTLDGAVADTLDGAVPDTRDAAVPDTLDAAVPDTLDAAVPDTLDGAVPDTLDAAVPDTLDAAVPDTLDSASADTAAATSFTATLDGAQEVPPNTGLSGTGTGTFTLNEAAGTLTYNITYSSLTGAATDAHIHEAPVGVDGSVVFDFSAGHTVSITSPITGTWTGLTPAQIVTLRAGGFYVNIHTAAFSGGEIRGQILP